MTATEWQTSNWPEDVSHDIDPAEYNIPLFQVLDEAARDYPDQVYTIFNDATRTFAQVKDTADRIAHFLHAAFERATGSPSFFPICPTIRPSISAS